MRISSFLVFLFVIFTVNSQSGLSLDDSNELMADNPYVEEIGNDVKLMSPGIVQLVLANGLLDVHVDYPNCYGDVLFCYQSAVMSKGYAAEVCQPNYCGFKISTTPNELFFVNSQFLREDFKKCGVSTQMKNRIASYCGISVASCDPAFDKDKVITIDVREVSESCPITILNAKIYVQPKLSTTTTSSSSSILSSSNEASTSNGTTILIVCIVVAVVVIIIIIVIAVVCYKKRANKKKKQAVNQDLKEVVIIKSVKEDTPEKIKEVVKVEHEKKEVKPLKVKEPAKKFGAPYPIVPKEDPLKVPQEIKPTESKPRKETTEATEEPPPPFLPAAPVIIESRETIVEHESPKKLKQQRQQNRCVHPFRKTSGSSGSRMRGRFKDSVESQRSLNKNTAYEAHYKSMARSGLIGKKMAESLAKDYKPNPKKKLLSVEISLLCNYVGDIFITINQLVGKAIEQLKEHGLKFNEDGRALKLSKPTRTYLQQPDTPEYIRFTCFALEFGHSISVDEEHLQKYSMALLLVVGFCLNHPDETRSHALAIFRRELPFWRRNSSIEERNSFGYPANAIEAAAVMNSDCFNDVKHVNTNSTPNNSEEKRSNSKSNGPSKEAAAIESKVVIIEKSSKKKKAKMIGD